MIRVLKVLYRTACERWPLWLREIARVCHIATARSLYFSTYCRLKVFGGLTPTREMVAIGLVEHMGDIVAAEPVSRQVRELHPNAHIAWWVRRPFAELIDNFPSVDQTVIVRCLTEWIWLRRSRLYDHIYDLHMRKRPCQVCKIALEKTEGNPAITLENYYQHGNLLFVACQNAGLPILGDQPRLSMPPSVSAKVDRLRLPNRFIVFHCRSNDPKRDWSDAKWNRLVTRVRAELDVKVVEIGNRSICADTADANVIDMCGALSIMETAEVIRRARLFVGIDSGPAHLANAVCTPGVILLGHYVRFDRYMPYSGGYEHGLNADILYADGPASEHPVDHVLAAIAKRLHTP